MAPLEWLGLSIAVAVTLGATWAVLRANLQRTTLTLYREDNDALRARVETLESERKELRERVADLTGVVAALREERSVLRDLATGASAVARLEDHVGSRLDTLEDLLRLVVDDRRHHDDGGPTP